MGFTIPPGTKVAGSPGFPADIDSAYIALSTVAGVNVLNTAYAGGADPTGVADSTAAFQAAVNAAAGGRVTVPAGTYLIASGPLTMISGTRITGAGWESTVIQSTTNSVISAASGSILESVEIDHVTLMATGSDVITGANISRWSIHHCRLTQNSAGNSIWGGAGMTQMNECCFHENREERAAGASVPAWNLTCAVPNINNNAWRDNRCFDSATAATWWYKLAYTGAGGTNGARNNVFANITIETPVGGLIRLESCSGTEIDGVAIWDLAASTVVNSMISVVKNGTAPSGCAATTVRNYDRMGGSSWTGGTADIQLDANASQTVIESPSLVAGGAALTLDLGSSAAVTLAGMPASYTLVNAPAATFADVNGTIWGSGNGPLPEDGGYAAWASDIFTVQGVGQLLGTAGVLMLTKIPCRTARSITVLCFDLTALGSGLTAGQNFCGLYSAAGTRIATSADQTTAWNTGGTIGAYAVTMTGGPFTVGGPGSGGFIWAAFVWNGTTTAPSFARPFSWATGLMNGGLTAASARQGSILTGQTSLPGSFTPSSVALTANTPWAAVR